MSTWVLILMFSWSSQSLAATSVPGFTSEAACMAAAKAAIENMGARRALCAKQ